MEFQKRKKEFYKNLGESCYMVLATSLNDKPLASMMTCMVFDEAIWVQTDSKFEKFSQIKENENVALCKISTQILAKAEIMGHPLENEKFIELLKKYQPDSFNMYSKLNSQVLIKLTPTYVTDWLYEAGSNEIINIDLVKEEVDIQQYKNDLK